MAAPVIVAVHLAVGATALLAATRRIGAAALGIIITIIIAAALHIAANRAQRQPPRPTRTVQAEQHPHEGHNGN
jgi:hypothetical protein